jgi:S-phase kinase-associated protein 1
MPGVRGDILAKVVEYLVYHKGVESQAPDKPLRSAVMKDVCKDPWDADYIDRIGANRQQLYELILAANYMDIKTLLHLGCAKVASLIKGQPLEKAKDILMKGETPAGPAHSGVTAGGPATITASPDKKDDKKMLQ